MQLLGVPQVIADRYKLREVLTGDYVQLYNVHAVPLQGNMDLNTGQGNICKRDLKFSYFQKSAKAKYCKKC